MGPYTSRLNRRGFLKKFGWGTASLAVAHPSKWWSRMFPGRPDLIPPNILFICTDYQSGEDGPSLGLQFLDMPALERLCRGGVVFSRYYSTAPVCQPARSTWITGQYPHSHDMWGNYEQWIPSESPVLMEILSRYGYYNLGIGKMHFKPWDRMAGFDRRIIADRKGNLESDKNYQDDYARFLSGYGLNRWDYLKLQHESETPHVYDWPFPPECHIDHYVGSKAQEVIEKGELDDKQPWFLWVSFNGPHNPWDPPAEYTKPYMDLDLPLPRTRLNEMSEKPMAATSSRYGYTKEVADFIDRYPEREQEYIKRIRAAHYGSLTFIDRQVEGILDRLEKKGLLEDTIIIYSADHGSLLGDHGGFHKGLIYERSSRVPFIIHCPTRFKAMRTNSPAGHVDLMPTILGLAGIPIPDGVEGKNLCPVLTGARTRVQDHIFIEISHNVGIVKHPWKMFVYPNGEGELYNLKNDPDELINLYSDPRFGKIRAMFEELLVEFRPENAARFNVVPPRILNRNEYKFKQGDVIIQGKPPYPPPQGGKTITVRAVIGPSRDHSPEGAFFVCAEKISAWPDRPPQNGYALYVKNDHPAMGVRIWDKDIIIEASKTIPPEKTLITGVMDRDGRILLFMNNHIVAEGRASTGLPLRPGRQEITAPSIYIGIGHDWGPPIGDYDGKSNFTGIIDDIRLKLQ